VPVDGLRDRVGNFPVGKMADAAEEHSPVAREVAQARAPSYADRYRPYADPAVADDPGAFNFQQFRSNVVFRWEYRSGSTLFLVWSQGREGRLPEEGPASFRSNLGDLFGRRPNDTFLIKVSYWLTP
jgi:hypothetical protein